MCENADVRGGGGGAISQKRTRAAIICDVLNLGHIQKAFMS